MPSDRTVKERGKRSRKQPIKSREIEWSPGDFLNVYRTLYALRRHTTIIALADYDSFDSMDYTSLLWPRLFIHRPRALNSSSCPDIHLLQFDEFCAFPELVTHQQYDKYRQQDIINDKIGRTEGVQEGCVALEEDEEDVHSQCAVCAVRIPQSLEG